MPGTSDMAAESATSAHQDRAADSAKGSSHVPALLARVPGWGYGNTSGNRRGVGADADTGALPDPSGSAAGTRAARPPGPTNTHARPGSGPATASGVAVIVDLPFGDRSVGVFGLWGLCS